MQEQLEKLHVWLTEHNVPQEAKDFLKIWGTVLGLFTVVGTTIYLMYTFCTWLGALTHPLVGMFFGLAFLFSVMTWMFDL